jgi:transcriptional regulator with XRE-family HTH domain
MKPAREMLVEKTGALSTRIRAARARSRLSLKEVAQRISVSDSAISQWETGRTVPTIQKLADFAHATGADLGWLRTGIKRTRAATRRVPKLTLSEATKTPLLDLSPYPADVWTHFPCSPAAFALEIFDQANAPEFQKGDLVIIDPVAAAYLDDMVLVARRAAAPLFGRLHYEEPSLPADFDELERWTGMLAPELLPHARDMRAIGTLDAARDLFRIVTKSFAISWAEKVGGKIVAKELEKTAQLLDEHHHIVVARKDFSLRVGTSQFSVDDGFIVGVMTEHSRRRRA